MRKNKKRLIWGLLILIISILFFLFYNTQLFSFSAFDVNLEESRLKQEYITYWGDVTDGNTEDKFELSLGYRGEPAYSQEYIGVKGGTVTTTKVFNGEEIVTLLDGGIGSFGENYCQLNNMDSFNKGGAAIIKFIPRTFEQTYDIYKDGVLTGNKPYPLRLQISCQEKLAGMYLFIGYKPQHQCELTPNDVPIQEQYASPFSFKDIEKNGFQVVKFCHETRPFILRDLNKGEVAINKNEGIIPITQGKTIPTSGSLPPNNIIYANYFTPYVAGVLNPTLPNQANVCQSRDAAGKCTRWVVQDVIKPTEITVQCQTNDDCPKPLNEKCPNYFKGCINKKCEYDDTQLNAPVCKNEVITIIREIQFLNKTTNIIITGANQFTFNAVHKTSSFNIGNEQFTATTDFTCAIPEGTTNYPNPSTSCYLNTASFNGQSYSLSNEQEIVINPHTQFKVLVGGTVKSNDVEYRRKEGLSSTYIFTITDPLDLKITESSKVLHNSQKTIHSKIINNLPSGKILLKVKQSPATISNFNLPEQSIETQVAEGENKVSFEMNTQYIGLNLFTVQSFYIIEIGNQKFLMPSNSFSFYYDVVDTLSSQPDIVYVNNTKFINNTVVVEKVVTVTKEPNLTYFWLGLGVASILILIMFVLLVKKMKRKRRRR